MKRLLVVLCLVGCGSSNTAIPDAATAADAAAATCGTASAVALMACVDRARYVSDLAFIAAPREPGSAHHLAVRQRCADRFMSLGFTVEMHDYGTGVNVIGTRTGTTTPDEHVLVNAHYDSTAGCPGADDNASGTAGLLEAARVLAMGTFPRTLVVACWDEEERGLVGSRAYASRAAAASMNIAANYDFEMIGFRDTTPGAQTIPAGFNLLFPGPYGQVEARQFRGDFLFVVNDEPLNADAAARLVAMGTRIGLPVVQIEMNAALALNSLTGDLRRSDHAAFWANSMPGMMITDTSNFRYDRYHCGAGPDTVDQLDHDFSVQIIQATVGSAAQMLGSP